MNRLSFSIICLCISIAVYCQKYISVDREVMKPVNDFSLNEFLMKDYCVGVPITEHKNTTRLSKLSGVEHISFLFSYGSLPLDFCSVNVHVKDGLVLSINGNIAAMNNIDTFPVLTPKDALHAALTFVHAESYSWQTKPSFLVENEHPNHLLQEPVPHLVICPNFRNDSKIPTLSYKIEILSLKPFEHQYVYINAKNGEIVHAHSLIHKLNGVADTRYSGTRTISTTYRGNVYNLVDESRGDGIRTYAIYNIPQQLAYILTDNDNYWTSSEYHSSKTDAALDAHWGAMKTYDYFMTRYNRNGVDDEGTIISIYANHPYYTGNAIWNHGNFSIYCGIGNTMMDAVTSLDVIAHELGHGITNSYQPYMSDIGESGAIKESISDIWAACVEHYAAPNKQCWRIGEDIMLTDAALRYLDDPKLGNDPDTYLGTFYLNPSDYPANEVAHTNCGISNHWFYLLAEGGTGINDNGYHYSVNGIGIDTAADIVYESLNYLQNDMTFAGFAAQTRRIAINSYDICSTVTRNVIEAWRAVGVPVDDISETINITDTLHSGYSMTYSTNALLTASNVVQNGATEILESATKIILAVGSRVELGASLTARIIPCSASNNKSDVPNQPRYDSKNGEFVSCESDNSMNISISLDSTPDNLFVDEIGY